MSKRYALPLGAVAIVAVTLLVLTMGHRNPHEAEAAGPAMQIELAGGPSCTGSSPNIKCTALEGAPFKVRLNAIPGIQIGGFQSETFLGGLAYKINLPCSNEVKMAPLVLCLGPTVGVGGQISHGGQTGIFPPLAAATQITPVVEFNATCMDQASHTIAVTVYPSSVLGSSYVDLSGSQVLIKPVGSLMLDFGGGPVPIDIADKLQVNCVGPSPTASPTETNTPTDTPTATSTPTATRTPTPTPLPSELPDVTISKTDSPDPVDANGTITYTLHVRNLGALPAAGVVAVDNLDPSTTFLPGLSSLACVEAPVDVVTCLIGALTANDNNPGGLDEIDLTIAVTAPTPDEDTHISDQASVSAANEPFVNMGNNKDIEQTVVLAPRADLTLIKTDEIDPVDSGATITYDLLVENIGPRTADNVVVRDNLPAGTTFLPGLSSPECTVPGGAPVPDPEITEVDIECAAGSLITNQQASFVIAVTAPIVARDAVLENLAYVSADPDDELFSQTGNNLDPEYTAVLAPPPDLTITKSGPSPVRRARYFDYTLTVTNNGQGDAFAVEVTDTLPATIKAVQPSPMRYVSAVFSPPGAGTCSSNQVLLGQILQYEVVNCTITKLVANGGSAQITLRVRAPTVLVDTKVTNNASVSDPDEPAEPTGDNATSVSTTIDDCRDVTGDGVVGLVDVTAVSSRFASVAPLPPYDLLYDFDGGSSVALFDVQAVAAHFAQVCVPASGTISP